jgi:hypothetical protein
LIEVLRALAVLSEPPSADQANVADLIGVPCLRGDEYMATFGRAHPYASFYLSAHRSLGGEAADRIAGFYRALEEPVPTAVDHAATVLGAYAKLMEREQEAYSGSRSNWGHIRATFLHEHVLSWFPLLAESVARLAPAYRNWSRLAEAVLEHETGRTAYVATTLPTCLSNLVAVPDPRRLGLESFIPGLLTPSRCGTLITEVDLRQCATARSLDWRIGTRQFVLRSLMEQDVVAVLEWLAEHLAVISACRRRSWWATTRIGSHWCSVADHTSDLLAELTDDARAAPGIRTGGLTS